MSDEPQQQECMMNVKMRCFWPFLLLVIFILPACTSMNVPQIIKATDMGRLNEINQLLGQGVDVNTATPEGVTPLFIASARGFEKITKRLIEKEADVNAAVQVTFNYEGEKVYQGCTSLLAAAANRRTEIVKMLLQSGADVNAGDINGSTPMMAAAAQGDKEIVKALIENGADLNAGTLTTYEYAGEPVFKGATALMGAIALKQNANAALLITHGADVNAKLENGSNALMISASYGDSKMVKYLLSKGADPDASITEDFMVKGKPAYEGGTALMAAADIGDAESVIALIVAGADVNAVTKNGATALMAAAAKGYLDVAKVLVASGADVNARTTEAFTIGKDPVPKGTAVMSGAAYNGHHKIVQLLIDNGAKVNSKDDDVAIDALFLAAEKGHIKVVKILVDNGADVWSETKMGTAHGVALHFGHPYVAQCINDARKKTKVTQEEE